MYNLLDPPPCQDLRFERRSETVAANDPEINCLGSGSRDEIVAEALDDIPHYLFRVVSPRS